MSDYGDNQLYRMLGKLEGMLESILTSLEAVKEEHRVLKETTNVRFDHYSNRIRALERFTWQIAGVLTIVPFAMTAVGWVLFK